MNLGPVDEAQISVSGPQVYLDATTVPIMAMILHELGTNSLKYGALSKTDGAVTIDWTATGQLLELSWREHGGPKVEAPIRRGFGTKLIEASARGAGGETRMSPETDGMRWDITLPLQPDLSADGDAADRSVSAQCATHAGPDSSDEPARANRLTGKRILIVEDEPLLAMEIAGQLEDAGAHIIGPAGNAPAALRLIEQYRFHGALLDANLSGQSVDDIAASLARKNIPFIFVTGYGRDSLPASFDDVELLPKPFHVKQLLEATTRLVG
jgi:CheY-like chemotaxis protein